MKKNLKKLALNKKVVSNLIGNLKGGRIAPVDTELTGMSGCCTTTTTTDEPTMKCQNI